MPRRTRAPHARHPKELPADIDNFKISPLALERGPTPEDRAANVDRVLGWYTERGLDRFMQHGAVLKAARALESTKKVLVGTGYNVAPGQAETDGPIGAARVISALFHSGVIPVAVTDELNRPLLKAALQEIDAEAVQFVEHHVFKAGAQDAAGAKREAGELWSKTGADATVMIEVPGQGDDGQRRNMRGLVIDGFNVGLDAVAIVGKEKGKLIVAALDGGNEIGGAACGNIPLDIPLAPNSEKMQSAVPADIVVTAASSNLAGAGLQAALLARAGKIALMPGGQAEQQAIRATMRLGAVDGVTRSHVPGHQDNKGKFSGTDGMSPELNGLVVDTLKAVATKNLRPAPSAALKPNAMHDREVVIKPVDSSNGGAIMWGRVRNYLKWRTKLHPQAILLLDHGNAPYGPQAPERVRTLGGKLMRASARLWGAQSLQCNTLDQHMETVINENLQQIRDDLMIRFDNDPHAEFTEAEEAIIGGSSENNYYIPLVEPTARFLVDSGDPRPLIFCTQGMFESGNYERLVHEMSGGKAKAITIACPEWAQLINDDMHVQPAHRHEVINLVRKYVKQIKSLPEAQRPTSLSLGLASDGARSKTLTLGCTHYPALLEAGPGGEPPILPMVLEQEGLSHLRINDPSEMVAGLIKGFFDQRPQAVQSPRNRFRFDDLVISTGDPKVVRPQMKRILGSRTMTLFVKNFDQVTREEVESLIGLSVKEIAAPPPPMIKGLLPQPGAEAAQPVRSGMRGRRHAAAS